MNANVRPTGSGPHNPLQPLTSQVLDRRRAGILLHPTSLPGGAGNGDLGLDAYRFVDFLQAAGVSVWQTLPLGPTDSSRSPYSAQSIYAGNPCLVSLEQLVDCGWLAAETVPPEEGEAESYRHARLQEARAGFNEKARDEDRYEYAAFQAEREYWLENHALFQALKETHNGASWWEWPKPLKDREPAAEDDIRVKLADSIEQHKFEQFLFFRQWLRLKKYANARGILLFGDMPVFVSEDSVTVWARRRYFRLNARGRPEVVAGVPPDYFSATGQRWGNPHYNWDRMRQDNFRWWRERVRNLLELFDLLRVDHFRGFEAYWEIPGSEKTALHGHWVKAPGAELFETLQRDFPRLPLVAEDLGVITREVEDLRDRFGFPGMKVLQFAFGEGSENPYLPHNHVRNSVVYSGTHDNNTTLGWFGELAAEERNHVCSYLGCSEEDMPWAMLRAVLASVSRLGVLSMQDVLELGSKDRMNVPGVADGNWLWRFSWDQLPPDSAQFLRGMVKLYGREVTQE